MEKIKEINLEVGDAISIKMGNKQFLFDNTAGLQGTPFKILTIFDEKSDYELVIGYDEKNDASLKVWDKDDNRIY